MKLLVAYDGTPGADAALADLTRAGLPDDASARVVCVASAGRASSGPELLRDEARLLAEAGAEVLRERFPGWRVTAGVAEGAPGAALVEAARREGAGLVVVGTRGLVAAQRAELGSVARQVSTDAECSVRVARPRERDAGPVRILVGADGSRGSRDAVDEVRGRSWADPPEILVLGVVPARPRERGRVAGVPSGPSAEEIEAAVETATAALRGLAGRVETRVLAGVPATVLLREAETWAADSVFLGGHRLQRLRRFVLGSVAGTVADEATCTVEVVRSSGS